MARQPFAPDSFDQVILGCVNVIADEMNPARVAALRLGMGESMVAFTMQINCGSGMQSIDTAYRYIREGHSNLILAGGAEALSYAPLVWPQQGVRWFAGLAGAKSVGASTTSTSWWTFTMPANLCRYKLASCVLRFIFQLPTISFLFRAIVLMLLLSLSVT